MRILSLAAVFVFLIALSPAVFAADGENNGANQNEPLLLLTSDPLNGAADVSLKPTIYLGFSKNVVNMAVKENNSTCFQMTDSEGNTVEISVYFPDDQVEPAEKHNIYITPVNNLKYNTSYALTISDALTAKSGSKLSSAVELEFRTMSEPETPPATDNENPASINTAAKNPAGSVTVNEALPETPVTDAAVTDAAAENNAAKSAADVSPQTAEEKTNSDSGIGYGIALLAFALLLVGAILHSKRRR